MRREISGDMLFASFRKVSSIMSYKKIQLNFMKSRDMYIK